MLRVHFVVVATSLGLMGLGTGMVSGQDYPSKSIRIVTASPGSGIDFNARQIAQGLSDSLGQQVIVENRIGIVPAETVSRASPDGYTLLVEASSFWITPLMQKTPYDVARDFSMITLLSSAPYVLVVHPSMPAKSVKELIDLAKAKPGQLNYASGGVGGGAHLAGALFASMAGINIVHVPYKGTAPGVVDLLGGQIQLMMGNPATVVPHLKSGKLRALAVTSARPSELAPGMPTVAASGVPGYEYGAMAGMFTPAKTPAAVINRLNQEAVRILGRQEVKERFINSGLEAISTTPEQFSALVKSDIAKWAKVIKEAGIKGE